MPEKPELAMGALDRIPRRLDVAQAHKAKGGWIAGILPIYYPKALFRAFNILPMEIWGPPNIDPTLGTAHLQPYICSIVRNALSFLQSEASAVVDLVLVPHACDSLQGLGSVLLDFVRLDKPVIPLYLPRAQNEAALCFLVEEFHSLYQQLASITGRSPSDEELTVCIQREEAADRVLLDLHHSRGQLPLSDEAFYRLIRTREFLPAEGFTAIAQEIIHDEGKGSPQGIPLLLSGILPEPMELLRAISAMGGRIVADDLACCSRRLAPPGKAEDPFLRMAESLINTPPEWNKGSPIQARLAHLADLVQQSGAEGVVFYEVKFCEPELFDLPDLRAGLQGMGVPSVTIEVDINEPLSNQILTRVEAFLEMIA
jgi:benzoyl-CoA reductase/2-hydroxyglutaryl-CoA dehydratase subunit BcrC/BadD/HgdB